MPNAKDITHHYHYAHEKKALLARMKRIEGQAKGILKMIEEERYCIDIVQQIDALSSAAAEIAILILQNHIEGCVADAIREDRGEIVIKEVIATIRKAIKR